MEEKNIDSTVDKSHMEKISEMTKNKESIDNEIKFNQHIEKLHLAAGNVDNLVKDKLNRETIESTESSGFVLKAGNTLVVKNTYDGTLPAWFTVPANAINPTISLCGGGGGGGGCIDSTWVNSAGGGSGGETIWNYPLNPGDTIYSVVGNGGRGGKGVMATGPAESGLNGETTIVEGSSNFPAGGLRAVGGNGGEGSRANRIAYGGQWVHSGNSYAISGQSGGNGGYIKNINSNPIYPTNGYPCYTVLGGAAGNVHVMNNLYNFGGGGGGATMLGVGGRGGNGKAVGDFGLEGVKGGGGGGAANGSYLQWLDIIFFNIHYANGGPGGKGWVRVQYYV